MTSEVRPEKPALAKQWVAAAAQEAVPDATVDRFETDPEGSAYEAHMTRSDASHVTVKVDEGFAVTTVEEDEGGGGGMGGGAPPGADLQESDSTASSASA
jgi:hypothetical protein